LSSIIVPIAQVDKVSPHPDPETTSLELIQVLGWQLVARKGQYTEGQRLVYVPPDSLLPFELSERLGVTNYLSKQRVRCIKLRGEPSFGLTFPPDEDWALGENVAEYYGITKYEPPVRMTGDDGEPEHPLFIRYTDIENLRNFPDVLELGEPVVISEKVDGTNCRIGLIEGQVICGSMRVQRKRPDPTSKKQALYWYPYTSVPGVAELLDELGKEHRQVILFGEVYGPGINSFNYGLPAGRVEFRVFDIFCDGKYLDWWDTAAWCKKYSIETVPILAEVPYSLEWRVKPLSTGTTTINGATHMREGVVVRPLFERTHPKTGRVILKYVSDEYLVKKSAGKVADYSEA
jgi:RNA ligase (TIGR02306 family)